MSREFESLGLRVILVEPSQAQASIIGAQLKRVGVNGLETVATGSELPEALDEAISRDAPPAAEYRAVFDPGANAFADIPLYRRADLLPGMRLAGPAIIAEDETSTFVSARFMATLNAAGYIVLERQTES